MQEFKTDIVINKMTKAQYDELLASDSVSDTELYYIIDDNDKYYLKSETYSKAEVDLLLGNSGGGGGNISLDNYYTKTETNTLVDGRISSLINAAPEAYDTLKEISDYIESDLSNTASMLASIANKANSADVYTKSEATAKFATLEDIPEEVDMTQYYTKEETLGVIDKISGLDNYYDKTEIDTKVTNLSSTKQDTLVSGTNIKTINGESILGEGNIAVAASGSGTSAEMTFKGYEDTSGNKTLTQIICNSDVWNLISKISQLTNDSGFVDGSYVDTKIAELVDSAPDSLNTLNELATAINNNKSLVDTLDSAITNKVDKSSIVYSETEPESPVLGMIWLKPV